MVIPDPKYKNTTVSRFINVIMKEGKKAVAERIVYRSFEIIAEKAGKPAMEVFQKAMDNSRPLLEIKARRIGGAT
jgi:small subunit ribosomal protein S7